MNNSGKFKEISSTSFYFIMPPWVEKTPKTGYVSINIGSKNMTDEKNETIGFEELVIP